MRITKLMLHTTSVIHNIIITLFYIVRMCSSYYSVDCILITIYICTVYISMRAYGIAMLLAVV